LTDFKFIMACKASIGFRKSAKNRPLEAALDTRARAGQPGGRPQSVRDAGDESFRRLRRAICETQLRVWKEKGDLTRNWPGSTERYALDGERRQPAEIPAPPVLRSTVGIVVTTQR
jgi:hypothetical protein